MSARILLVEDNPTTARTLRVFLDAQGYEVVEAGTGRAAIARFGECRPDLVVLDLMLPDVDGLEVCRTIRRQSVSPIVMLTARTADDDVVEGLEAGADDYVCKPFASKVLLARIRRCLDRAAGQSPPGDLLRYRDVTMDLDRRRVERQGRAVRLTPSEFDILHRLLRNPGRVFTRTQLLDAMRDQPSDAFDRVVDTHIWSLRRKLGEPRGRPRLILSEPGIGYRLADDEH